MSAVVNTPAVPELVQKLDRTLSKARYAISEADPDKKYTTGQLHDIATTAIDAIGVDFQNLKSALGVK